MNASGATWDVDRFWRAVYAIGAENAGDPRRESADGAQHPTEWLYARRLSAWVGRLAPLASEELRLAAHALHVGRWRVPRSDFPMTRVGYHRWRDRLRDIHAERAGEILFEAGYASQPIARVQELILRSTFPDDPESRVIEDAVTMLFLQYQLADLADKTEHGKMLRVLRRAWGKLTARGRALALCLSLSNEETVLVCEALDI